MDKGNSKEGLLTESQPAFSRALTFEGFNRATSTLSRTITGAFTFLPDPEEKWAQDVINDYVRVAKKGVDGDVPHPGGFAKERRYHSLCMNLYISSILYVIHKFRFWKVIAVSLFLGCFMGLLGLCFLNLTDQV
jgi:hypothetical protein